MSKDIEFIPEEMEEGSTEYLTEDLVREFIPEIKELPEKKQATLNEIRKVEKDTEFQEYYKSLNSNPYYTKMTDEVVDGYTKMSLPMKQMSLTLAKKHPFLWGKWVCGITPYDYQFKMLDDMNKYRFMISNTARQIGKSFVIGVYAFWAAYNNKFPVGIDKKTKIGIVSATEDQAKKLLKDIYKQVQCADGVFAKLTKGTSSSSAKYFTDKMVEKPTAYKLEWSGGSIECFPPTRKLRGNSLSFLFIDEGDFLGCEKPDYFFKSEAMPTLKKTGGSCFIFSTPSGLPSFYQNIFKPTEPEPLIGWKRIWYNWTIHKADWVSGWSAYKQALEDGDLVDFEAEFEAKFTSGRHSFFNPEKLDKCVNTARQEITECTAPVYVGIDFSGGGKCRTAVSFAYWNQQEEKSIVLQSKEFVQGYENDKLVNYLNTWKRRYNIHTIVAEKCPAGETPISLIKRAGYRVIEFNSRADKIVGYMNMEIAINNERIELYPHKTAISQLKGLEAVETKMNNIQIHKVSGMLDDVADSVMFAVSEFTKPKKRGKRRVL